MSATARRDGPGVRPMPPGMEARCIEGAAYCARFFMGESEAHKALERLVAILEAEDLPYAIIGGLALNAYGHVRATVDVDLVMRDDDLDRFKRAHLGHGYAERVPGTGKLLDTENDVHVDVLSTGRFPGDGRPKPISFPDPATAAVRGERFRLLPVARFIELKLASGMTAARRLRDLADVQDLVISAHLPASIADDLHPWVRDKFLELWHAAQVEDPY
ncbi:MAG: hypothetical protein FJ087_18595 [Deltaproteobacteria bacterium]|nr:hypothetical protein [Deltaproteobacteria bacterium]